MFDLSQATVIGESKGADFIDRQEESQSTEATQPAETVETTSTETPSTGTPDAPEDTEKETHENSETQTEEVPKDDFPADRFGGRFSSWDEVSEFINKEQKEPEYKDEFIKKLVEKYNTDGSLKDYFEAHSVDWEKMDSREVLRRKFFNENPDIDDKYKNKLFERELAKYNIDPDSNDEEEVELGMALLERDANKYRNERIEENKKYLEPQKQEDNTGAKIEALKKFRDTLPEIKSLREDKKIKFNAEGEEFNFEVDDPEFIAETLVDEQAFNSLFTNNLSKEGKIDTDKWIKTVEFARNPEKFIQSFIDHGKNLGRKEFEATLKNTDLSGREPDQPKTDGDHKSKLLQAFLEKGVTKRF